MALSQPQVASRLMGAAGALAPTSDPGGAAGAQVTAVTPTACDPGSCAARSAHGDGQGGCRWAGGGGVCAAGLCVATSVWSGTPHMWVRLVHTRDPQACATEPWQLSALCGSGLCIAVALSRPSSPLVGLLCAALAPFPEAHPLLA